MKTKIAVVSLLLALFFSSCEKDYSYEGGGVPIGVAAYTFDGGSGSCTGAVINGTFTKGMPASSTNTAVLNVVVDSIGTYNITTTSVNGIRFAGSGIFATPGDHVVTLTATGTPVAAGDFNFTPGVSGCSFSVTVDSIATDPVDSVTYYYEATIDGVYHKETVSLINGYLSNSDVSGGNSAILLSNVMPVIYPSVPAGKTGLGFSKGLLRNYNSANNTEFKTFFNLGIYPYSNDLAVSDGVIIAWYDEDGNTWSTDNAPADQSGSSFQITMVEDVVNSSPVYAIAVTAVFNCKLYDDNGNMKTLTGGKYYGKFEKQ